MHLKKGYLVGLFLLVAALAEAQKRGGKKKGKSKDAASKAAKRLKRRNKSKSQNSGNKEDSNNDDVDWLENQTDELFAGLNVDDDFLVSENGAKLQSGVASGPQRPGPVSRDKDDDAFDWIDDDIPNNHVPNPDATDEELLAELKTWATWNESQVSMDQRSASNNIPNSPKPRKRSNMVSSLLQYVLDDIFTDAFAVRKNKCANRENFGQPICCDGEDNFCSSPIGTCYCDESCAYFGDCCDDYKQTCGFVDLMIRNEADNDMELSFSKFSHTYQMARATCVQRGGKLVAIKTQEIYQKILTVLNSGIFNYNADYWIGLDDLKKESKFRWSDGSEEKEHYTIWAANNPVRNSKKGAQQDCIALLYSREYKYADNKCGNPRRFICQKKIFGEDDVYRRGVAKITGDPHLITFDNYILHFENSCEFILTELCSGERHPASLDPFFITGEINEFATPDNEHLKKLDNIHLHLGYSDGYISNTFSILKGKTAEVNKKPVKIPYVDREGNMIQMEGEFLKIKTAFGLVIYSDGNGHAEIELPEVYKSRVCGLLGNFNGIPTDDLQDRRKGPFTTMKGFAEYWRMNENPSCKVNQYEYDINDKYCPPENYEIVKKHCMNLLLRTRINPFYDCLNKVDTNHFFEMCATEMCNYENVADIPEDAHCIFYETLILDCRRRGYVNLDWRSPDFCPKTCPTNAHYDHCGDSCPETCFSTPSNKLHCPERCVEGCFCDEGYVWRGNECVDEASGCGCTDEDGNIWKARQRRPKDGCKELCTCNGETGELVCKPMKCRANQVCTPNKSVPGYAQCVVIKTTTTTTTTTTTKPTTTTTTTTTTSTSTTTTTPPPTTTTKEKEPDALRNINKVKPWYDTNDLNYIVQEDDSCLDEEYVVPVKPQTEPIKGFHGTAHPGGQIINTEGIKTIDINAIKEFMANAANAAVKEVDALWVKPDKCCGIPGLSKPYNSDTHGCCRTKVYNLETHKCCGESGVYVRKYQTCPEKLFELNSEQDPAAEEFLKQHENTMQRFKRDADKSMLERYDVDGYDDANSDINQYNDYGIETASIDGLYINPEAVADIGKLEQ